jgi:O-antigen ligase
MWNRAVFAGLLVLVVWMPIPVGSGPQAPMSLLAMTVWGLVMVWLAAAAATGHTDHVTRIRRGGLPLVLSVGLCLIMVAQLSQPVHGWAELSTLEAFRTRLALLTSLLYLGVFVLVLLCVHDAVRAAWVLGTMLVAGVLQAVMAATLWAGQANYLFLFFPFDQGGRATGTFFNTDHLAGYMVVCLSAGLGLLMAQFGGDAKAAVSGWQQQSRAALAFILSPKMLVRVSLVVLVVVLVMTHSRAGNGAFFFSLLLVGTWIAIVSSRLRKPAIWLVVSMAVIDIFIIGQWVGLDRVVDRMKGTVASTRADLAASRQGAESTNIVATATLSEESVVDRLRVPTQALELVPLKPWFGHGGGNFEFAFPAVKLPGEPIMLLKWDMAHNDYVQTAAELGIAGLLLFVGLGAATLWRAARLLPDRQPRTHRGVGVAGLMVLCCLGLHIMVDFVLQTPAIAATLMALLAVVWALPMQTASRSRRQRSAEAA